MKIKFDKEDGTYYWFVDDIEIKLGRITKLSKDYLPNKWNCTRYDIPKIKSWNNLGFFSENVEDYESAHIILMNGWDDSVYEKENFQLKVENITYIIYGCSNCAFVKKVQLGYPICTLKPFVQITHVGVDTIINHIPYICPLREKITLCFNLYKKST